jgi:uncharacterized protein
MTSIWLLPLTGLLAGFIDSIAGGGGLITLPAFALLLGPGAQAIGTNKIGATVAALTALLVYRKAGHFNLKVSLLFTVFVVFGSFMGSRLSPSVPPEAFKFLLLTTCPLILWIVYRKDFWVSRDKSHEPKLTPQHLVASAGLICGFYDGIWGPGGGTFMFLSLLFVARLPLVTAMAASKLANTASGATSLASYASQGLVHWKEGLLLSVGIGIGAYLGARFATRVGSPIVRPILLVVVTLLLLRIFLA